MNDAELPKEQAVHAVAPKRPLVEVVAVASLVVSVGTLVLRFHDVSAAERANVATNQKELEGYGRHVIDLLIGPRPFEVRFRPSPADVHQAARDLERMVEISEVATITRVCIALHERAVGRFETALGLIEALYLESRQSSSALARSGGELLETVRVIRLDLIHKLRGLNEATLEARRQVDEDSQSTNAHFNYASYLSQAGRYDEAYAAARRAMELSPGNLRAKELAGQALSESASTDAEHQRALQILEEVVGAYDLGWRALFNAGKSAFALANYAQAEVYFKRCVAIRDFAPAYANLGVSRLRLSALSRPSGSAGESVAIDAKALEAILPLEKACELDPSCLVYWMQLADAHRILGNYEESYRVQRAALSAHADNVTLLTSLVYSCLFLGRTVEARKYAEYVVTLPGAYAISWQMLGAARLGCGDPAGALEAYKKLEGLYGKPAWEISLGLQECYEALGDSVNATKHKLLAESQKRDGVSLAIPDAHEFSIKNACKED